MHEASFRAVAGWSNQNIHNENTLRACFALELITPTFEAYLGIRYMWLDDTEVGGVDVENLDDLGLGLGLRFNI